MLIRPAAVRRAAAGRAGGANAAAAAMSVHQRMAPQIQEQ